MLTKAGGIREFLLGSGKFHRSNVFPLSGFGVWIVDSESNLLNLSNVSFLSSSSAACAPIVLINFSLSLVHSLVHSFMHSLMNH
jgi:hypothetical protein